MRKLKKQAVLALLQEFVDHGLPCLCDEMKAHFDVNSRDYGRFGPAMNFYIKYKDYLKDVSLDDLSDRQIAQLAVIYECKD